MQYIVVKNFKDGLRYYHFRDEIVFLNRDYHVAAQYGDSHLVNIMQYIYDLLDNFINTSHFVVAKIHSLNNGRVTIYQNSQLPPL